ncbi:MAG: ABC transporter ATP-binding protein [Exilispira sp.]|nr:ABC transporter ATP-binding protein [Exilispira sp.]
MLNCKDITVSFGGLVAVNNMNLLVEKGSIHALIGPNGAGKTTLFNAITRIVDVDSGEITFENINILSKKPFEIINYGIVRTFQNLKLSPYQTIKDNIITALTYKYKGNVFSSVFRSYSRFLKEAEEIAFNSAKIFGIQNRMNSYIGALPYGILKKVELARALAVNPKLLLLDEPAAGLNTDEKKELDDILLKLKSMGITILLVEHDMNLVMRISDLVTVMDFGKFIARDKPEHISKNEDVIKVYLGNSYDIRNK